MNLPKNITPLMQQYFALKAQHADALLLFQVGDFYELFFDDAQKAAAFLGITLTKRGTFDDKPIPLCGVPVHALEHYLNKLVRGGFQVALCDQLEVAQPGKVVERGITRIFTPGTLVETQLLDAKSASYIFTFVPLENEWGLLFGELLTAQLFATTLTGSPERMLESELVRFFPDEILLPESALGKPFHPYFKKLGYFTTSVAPQDTAETVAWSSELFKPEVALYIKNHAAVQIALETFYAYLRKTKQAQQEQFTSLHIYSPDDFLILDPDSVRNLELIKNNTDGSAKNSLFSVLDRAITPMGSRMIKKWLLRPLVKQEAIVQRQEVIEQCIADSVFLQEIIEQLSRIGDIERIVGRIGVNRALFGDYKTLLAVLQMIPGIKKQLAKKSSLLIQIILSSLESFEILVNFLHGALNIDDQHEWIIKAGFDEQLDATRSLINNGTTRILDLEKKEQDATGISSLKIRYNSVHGYSIEITNTHAASIPTYYKRQQTLVGRERFTIEALTQLEHAILNARHDSETREKELFEQVKRAVFKKVADLRKAAHALAYLDALVGFAQCAYDNRYCKPIFHNSRDIIIKQGRHPVIELQVNQRFIANDTALDDNASVWIVTGPNMGGKSTYLRQVALISIMAQIGSFVPAQEAYMPLLDRIFTRIGAGDDLARGKSTFLVEMEEAAAICTYATDRSLVILDEVGRGTSTFDGRALAQAIVEYIYDTLKSRCLFATHYHELALLKEKHKGIVSYYAASKRTRSGVVFLYTIIEGVAEGSFGIDVARLAQLPESIVQRAGSLLEQLTASHEVGTEKNISLSYQSPDNSSELVALKKIVQELDAIDYDTLSPKKAFDILWAIKENNQVQKYE